MPFSCKSQSSWSSSAHHSPLLATGLSNCSPSCSIFGYYGIQLLSAVLRKLSVHLAWGLTLRLPRRGLHSRTRLPQLTSVLRLIWPALCHFSMLIRYAMSDFSSLLNSFRIRSRRETPSIGLSISRWATLSFFVNTYILYLGTPRPKQMHVHANKCLYWAKIEPKTSCATDEYQPTTPNWSIGL
jgi:hypothetical protein